MISSMWDRYLSQYGHEAHTAPAYEHNAEFSRVLADRMAFYSADQRADTINRVRGEITEVKNVMIQNIDKVRRSYQTMLQRNTAQRVHFVRPSPSLGGKQSAADPLLSCTVII